MGAARRGTRRPSAAGCALRGRGGRLTLPAVVRTREHTYINTHLYVHIFAYNYPTANASSAMHALSHTHTHFFSHLALGLHRVCVCVCVHSLAGESLANWGPLGTGEARASRLSGITLRLHSTINKQKYIKWKKSPSVVPTMK